MPRPSNSAPESPDYLIIDESRTSNDVGIWVDTPPMPPMAEHVYREINIPDREESLTVIDETYNDIPLAVKAYIFDNAYDITSVYSWLRGAKKLRFKDDDYYYRVKQVKPPTLNPPLCRHQRTYLPQRKEYLRWQRSLQMFFPPVATIGSGRCQFLQRPGNSDEDYSRALWT